MVCALHTSCAQLLAFITATIYFLVASVIFCTYMYGTEAGIGLTFVVLFPVVKVSAAWHYLEQFDRRSFALTRQLEARAEAGSTPLENSPRDVPRAQSGGLHAPLQRSVTVVGHSNLLEAMKEKAEKQKDLRSRSRRSLVPRIGAAPSASRGSVAGRGRSSKTILPSMPISISPPTVAPAEESNAPAPSHDRVSPLGTPRRVGSPGESPIALRP